MCPSKGGGGGEDCGDQRRKETRSRRKRSGESEGNGAELRDDDDDGGVVLVLFVCLNPVVGCDEERESDVKKRNVTKITNLLYLNKEISSGTYKILNIPLNEQHSTSIPCFL